MPEVIKYDDRHKIRDLFIPLGVNKEGGTVATEALFSEAYCYTGQPEPFLIFDGADSRLVNWLLQLYTKATSAPRGARNWRISHEGESYRAHIGTSASGPDLILRALPKETPNLQQLVMPHAWKEVYTDPSLLYGGLVLVTAKNGMAKTTTISAAVRSRLELFGGHCNTVEDPPELPLQGLIGKGACRQIPVGVDQEGDDVVPGAGFADALAQTRREFPAMTGGGTILMIGEVRDNHTAAELLTAAFEGHLVLATFHSASIQHALMRLTSMAGAVLGVEQARQLLAATLRAIFHQQLTLRSTGEGWARGEIKGKVLIVPNNESAIHGEIEHGHFMDKIKGRVDEQNRRLESLGAAGIAEIRKVLATA